MARDVNRRHTRRGGLAVNLLQGAVAGAAATWLMGRATTWMYEREDTAAREREERARGGRSAYARAVGRAASAVGRQLPDVRQEQAGAALHWIAGTAAGAAYAAASRRWPGVRRAGGLPFGAGFFLTVDEGMNTVLGFTPGPRAFPWQTHARGFVGHLVFGFTVEMLLRAMDALVRHDAETPRRAA